MGKDKNTSKSIMFYINILGGGGAERVICNLSNMFSERGYTVYLVASEKCEKEYYVADSVNKIYLENEHKNESFLKRNLSRIKKLRALCKKHKPWVLVSFMAEPNYRAVIAALCLKTKCIISVRNDPNREYSGKKNRFLAKTLFKLADGCVFQTEDAKKWFPKSIQKKSAIILNQVNERFFEDFPQGPNQNNIVAVGRLEKQKNHALLIEAFASIADKHPDTQLIIYGEGNLREQLEALAGQKGIAERVLLPGNVSNVPEMVYGCGCYALSSDYEGMPNTLLEALALGSPCVSTDCPCGGAATVIRNGVNGILVPVGDSHKLAAALDRILSDRELALGLKTEAKRSADAFRPDVIYGVWEDFIFNR